MCPKWLKKQPRFEHLLHYLRALPTIHMHPEFDGHTLGIGHSLILHVCWCKETDNGSRNQLPKMYFIWHAFFLLWHLMSIVVDEIELTSAYYRNTGNKRITREMNYLKQKSMNQRADVLPPKFNNNLLTTNVVGWPLLDLGWLLLKLIQSPLRCSLVTQPFTWVSYFVI